MKERPSSLFDNHEFKRNLDSLVAHAVYEALRKTLPVLAVEAAYICKSHGLNYRFDATKTGQNVDLARVNLFTDGTGVVTRVNLG